MAEKERAKPVLIHFNPHHKTRENPKKRRPVFTNLASPAYAPENISYPEISKIQIKKEYGSLERSMMRTGYPNSTCVSDFEGIIRIAKTLVDRYYGNFSMSQNMAESNSSISDNGRAKHSQRILHAEILSGPTIHSSMETFEDEPKSAYLRVEITEGSRSLGHCAMNTVPLAYPPIARLLAVVTTLELPKPSRYHPRKEGGLVYLLGQNGQVL